MASFTPIFISISPFAKPQAPPQPVVVLLDATELHIRPPAPLLAFEDLRPDSFKKSPNHPAVRKVKFHPYNRKEANIVPSSARQPTPQPTTSHQISAPPPASADSPATDDLADMSPLSSPASSPRSSPVPNEFRHVSLGVVSTKIKIERPKGAARKNLQDQVKWDPAFMADIKVLHPVSFLFTCAYAIQKRARNLVRTHLNDALCFKDQEQSKLNHVRTEVNGFLVLSNIQLTVR